MPIHSHKVEAIPGMDIGRGGMARAFDHLVVAVENLEHAGEALARLGFALGACNEHPWGTYNRLVRFSDGTFIEVISANSEARARLAAENKKAFSFGGFVALALARRQGPCMLALASQNAMADAAAFAQAGIGVGAPFEFSRQGLDAHGQEAEFAFTLAFAQDITMRQAGFFTCERRKAALQMGRDASSLVAHPNGAVGVARITLVAENPSDHHIFLGDFLDQRVMRATSFGLELETGDGVRIESVSAEGFMLRYGVPMHAPAVPYFAAFEVKSTDLHAVQRGLRQADLAVQGHAGGLTVVDAFGPGTGVLRFVRA